MIMGCIVVSPIPEEVISKRRPMSVKPSSEMETQSRFDLSLNKASDAAPPPVKNMAPKSPEIVPLPAALSAETPKMPPIISGDRKARLPMIKQKSIGMNINIFLSMFSPSYEFL